MAGIQEEIQAEVSKYKQRFEQTIRDILSRLSQMNTKTLKEQLAEGFCKRFLSNKDETFGALAVPDEMLEDIESWLQENKTPYVTMPTGNRENVVLLGGDDLKRGIEYMHTLEHLNPNYTAWTKMEDFIRDTDLIKDKSVCVFDFGESATSEMNEEDIELRDELIDKIHDNGNGYAIGYSDIISGQDEQGRDIHNRRLAVRLEGAMNANEKTPDFITVCAETAVDQTNMIKIGVKTAAHKIDDRNLDMFIRDIDTHTTGYLENAYSTANKASLRYDEKSDRVLYTIPGTMYERVLINKEGLEKLRSDPSWRMSIKSQLSHYTQSIENMTHFTPEEKREKDLSSESVLLKKEEDNAELLYKNLEKVATTKTKGGEIDVYSMVSDQNFTTRPTFNSRIFRKIVKDRIDKGESIPKAIITAMHIDDFKDDVEKTVSSYVREQSQKLSGYSPQGAIEKTIAQIKVDFANENGIFKDISAKAKELRIEEAIPVIKNNFDNMMSKIEIKSVSQLKMEEEMSRSAETKDRGHSARDVNMDMGMDSRGDE